MTLKIDKAIVTEEWDLPYSGNADPAVDVEILSDTITDTSRWSVHHKLIVRIKDKFYQTYYSVGATEQQYESAWENDTEIEFNEVKQVEKMVTVWETVSD